MKNFKKTVQILMAVSLFMGIASPAYAAFPGSNGKLVYSDFIFTNGQPSAAPFISVNLDGTQKTTLNDEVATTSLSAGSGRFSADGTKLVFIKTDVNTGQANVFIMNQDGSNQANLSNLDLVAFPDRSEYSATYASFNPDNKSIVYTEYWGEDFGSGTEAVCHIMTVDINGANKAPLTNDPTLCDIYPVYSPAGNKIAFVRYDKSAQTTGIYVMNADGSNVVLVKQLSAGSNFNPGDFSIAPLGTVGSSFDWSPDGSKLVYATYEQDNNDTITSTISTTDLQGNVAVIAQLSSQQFDTIESAGRFANEAYFNPQFTPEGQVIFRKLSISTERSFDSGSNDWISQNNEGTASIIMIDASGANLRALQTSATLYGNDADFALFQLAFPSVQPIQATKSVPNSIAQLASTGSSMYLISLGAVITVLLSLTIITFRKYER